MSNAKFGIIFLFFRLSVSFFVESLVTGMMFLDTIEILLVRELFWMCQILKISVRPGYGLVHNMNVLLVYKLPYNANASIKLCIACLYFKSIDCTSAF